jgi:hypothetical protein
MLNSETKPNRILVGRQASIGGLNEAVEQVSKHASCSLGRTVEHSVHKEVPDHQVKNDHASGEYAQSEGVQTVSSQMEINEDYHGGKRNVSMKSLDTTKIISL